MPAQSEYSLRMLELKAPHPAHGGLWGCPNLQSVVSSEGNCFLVLLSLAKVLL